MPRIAFSFLIISLLSICSSIAIAQPFQNKVLYNYSRTSAHRVSPENVGNTISYTYFLSEVENSNVPIREVEFSTRISSLGLNYSMQDTENRTSLGGSGFQSFPGANTKFSTLFGEYKHRDSGWFLGGSLSTGKTDSVVSQDQSSYRFNFGKYIADYTSVTVGYSESENDTEPRTGTFCSPPLFSTSCNDFILDQKQENKSYDVSFRHLQEIGSQFYAFGLNYQNLESTAISTVSGNAPLISGQFTTDRDAYSGDVTAYWGKRLSTTLSYFNIDSNETLLSNSQGTEQFGLALEYFFLPKFSVSVGYTQIKADAVVALGVNFPINIVIVPNDFERYALSLRASF